MYTAENRWFQGTNSPAAIDASRSLQTTKMKVALAGKRDPDFFFLSINHKVPWL